MCLRSAADNLRRYLGTGGQEYDVLVLIEFLLRRTSVCCLCVVFRSRESFNSLTCCPEALFNDVKTATRFVDWSRLPIS